MTKAFSMRPIFIGACPRSGTTFLGDRLGSLLKGRVMPESQFKRPALQALAQNGPEAALAALDQDRTYRLWTERPTREALLECSDAASFLSRLVFPNGVPPEEEPIWIDHTPVNFEDFHTLRQIFPEAKFVSLVRDGRAVFSSVQKLAWGPHNPMHASWWWASRTAPGLAASLTYPDVCMTVRYEDLARGDLDCWTGLLRFLTGDNTRHATAEDLSAGSGFDVPDFTRHQHKLVGGAPSAARAEGWKKELSERDIEIFEGGNGGALLGALGYERLYPYPRAASRSERIRMGEWPVRITMEPMKKLNQAFRWSKVKKPSKTGST